MTQPNQRFRAGDKEKAVTTAWAARLVGTPRGKKTRHTIRQAWIEVPLDDAWMVAYQLVNLSGEPVVAEVRVFPNERGKGRPPGVWSAEFLGVNARAPAGGI